MGKGDKEPDISEVIGGALNICGLKIDLGKLLSSPENMKDQLEELRQKLKKAGGKEVLGDEEWKRGETSISGQLRTRGILGEREYHIGTGMVPGKREKPSRQRQPPEVGEPAVDIFHEPEEIMVIAEVPGVALEDLELKVQDAVLYLSTRATARRNYKKEVKLGSPVEEGSWKTTCRNGILEIHLKKRKP